METRPDSARGAVAPVAAGRPLRWGRLVGGVFAIYVVFDLVARSLGSLRGEWGLLVGAIVLGATVAVDRWHSGGEIGSSLRRLGLGLPDRRGLLPAAAIAAALVATIPVFAVSSGATVRVVPEWAALVAGLFAQAGIAEEVLFRGLLFGTIRRYEPRFARAAALAGLPFIAVHLPLLFTLEWPIAVLSIALAAIVSVPLARLFEVAGGTIWGAALVHTVIQGALKIATVDSTGMPFAPLWMLACATLPWLVFASRRASR